MSLSKRCSTERLRFTEKELSHADIKLVLKNRTSPGNTGFSATEEELYQASQKVAQANASNVTEALKSLGVEE